MFRQLLLGTEAPAVSLNSIDLLLVLSHRGRSCLLSALL